MEHISSDLDSKGALLTENGVEEDVMVVRKHIKCARPWSITTDGPRAALDTVIAGILPQVGTPVRTHFEKAQAHHASYARRFWPAVAPEGGLPWKNNPNPLLAGSSRRIATRSSPDTRMPNVASPESAPTVRQRRIDRKSGRIRKPTRPTTKPTGRNGSRHLVAFSSTADDLRAAQLLHWHKELEKLVAHWQLRTNSQREASEAELRNIHNARVEIEDRLAELESRASQLTQSFEAEGRTHRPIDTEALRSLEEAVSRPALAEALPITTQDQLSLQDQVLEISRCKAPVVGTNALHDAYGSSYSYMGELDSLHKRRKSFREADETEQETFHGSVEDSLVTTRSMTFRRTAVQ
ncbi:hypothetical protein V490_00130 [Pseudogymnoascus sp. VKM F-3557]|nr:hypothetical protein V490_00130 [Pseudogymnoascus sp. VKM F-3557]